MRGALRESSVTTEGCDMESQAARWMMGQW